MNDLFCDIGYYSLNKDGEHALRRPRAVRLAERGRRGHRARRRTRQRREGEHPLHPHVENHLHDGRRRNEHRGLRRDHRGDAPRLQGAATSPTPHSRSSASSATMRRRSSSTTTRTSSSCATASTSRCPRSSVTIENKVIYKSRLTLQRRRRAHRDERRLHPRRRGTGR